MILTLFELYRIDWSPKVFISTQIHANNNFQLKFHDNFSTVATSPVRSIRHNIHINPLRLTLLQQYHNSKNQWATSEQRTSKTNTLSQLPFASGNLSQPILRSNGYGCSPIDTICHIQTQMRFVDWKVINCYLSSTISSTPINSCNCVSQTLLLNLHNWTL